MTYYDVHINRIPYSGILNYRTLPPIKTHNFPLIFEENSIFDGNRFYINRDMEYLRDNARMINKIYSTKLDYTYYIIQYADEEVNVITPFHLEKNAIVRQGERFSFVRRGSQCDLVLPLDKRYKFKPLWADLWHIEGR